MPTHKTTTTRKPRYIYKGRVYVLELDPKVLQEPRFLAQNPDCRKNPGLGCLYVGSTDDVEKRIRIHLHGPGPGDNQKVRASKLVRKHFLWRREDLEHADVYETSGHAITGEALEAEYLRDQGYRVYSN
jgi:predicted GIY-YIG superfamily endonuclease